MRKRGYVYMRANCKNGTLYVGVTAHLNRRNFQHETGLNPESFVVRHNLVLLVYVEVYESIVEAIEREKKLKDLPRIRKLRLIEKDNPEWLDLTASLGWVD